MKKSEIKQLIREEVESILNDGGVEWNKEGKYPKIYPDGTEITYNSRPATILYNFMDRGAPYAGYVIQFEDGTTKEISSASKDIDIVLSNLNEVYQDQYKVEGRLVTNIKSRPQNEVLSDIRSIAGVTVVSTKELQDYNDQSFGSFTTILNLKIDGYPYIKTGGFSRETISKIADDIRKVPNVISFKYNPESVTPITK
tara:strand:- start:1377 stop:1970 length:594 start_codon:yes stop_codon:yes gene_type:complete